MTADNILERLVRLETRFDDYVAAEKERVKAHQRRITLAVSVIAIVVTVVTTVVIHIIV